MDAPADISSTAKAELVQALNRQQRNLPLSNGEKRFPRCSFEDMGLKVLAIPSRLFYAFENAVDGYHEQRKSANLQAEASLMLAHLKPQAERGALSHIHLIDVGGGDGIRGLNIAMALHAIGVKVEYTCYDGSDVMLSRNREAFSQTPIQWHGINGRFEDFPNVEIARNDPATSLFVLFLGNNFGNYSVDDIADMLVPKGFADNDRIVIGSDVPVDDSDGEFVLKEFLKYHDDGMRMGAFTPIGIDRSSLVDLFQYSKVRNQIEVYSVLVKSPREETGLALSVGDIFLCNVARRPPVTVLRDELGRFFSVEILRNTEVDERLALAVCSRPQ